MNSPQTVLLSTPHTLDPILAFKLLTFSVLTLALAHLILFLNYLHLQALVMPAACHKVVSLDSVMQRLRLRYCFGNTWEVVGTLPICSGIGRITDG